ncbi:MAG: HD domain-containing protein [Desulfosarcinaceae bacterium]
MLLPAGAVLTEDLMADLIQSSPHSSFDRLKVMEHGRVAEDLRAICDTPPYHRIFSNHRRFKHLFALLEKVRLASPLMEIIDFIKQYDPYTYRHILTVFALSVLLAQDFFEESSDLRSMAQACTTHDLGKFCVPAAVLKKTSLLGEVERNSLEHHAGAGYVLLSYYFKDPRHPTAITARDHHERCDGSGYPSGVQLDSRIVEIVAVCDVFDALIAHRPYRPTAYDLRTALEEITSMAESGAIPWDIAKALINYNRSKPSGLDSCVVSRTKRGTPPSDNLYSGVGKSAKFRSA